MRRILAYPRGETACAARHGLRNEVVIRWRRLPQLAVAGQHLIAVPERARQPLDEIDRAMLASRAADGDGQVIAVVARVLGQPGGDEMMDVGVHALDFRLSLEVVD